MSEWTNEQWREYIDSNDGLGPGMAHRLLDKLDAANELSDALADTLRSVLSTLERDTLTYEQSIMVARDKIRTTLTGLGLDK